MRLQRTRVCHEGSAKNVLIAWCEATVCVPLGVMQWRKQSNPMIKPEHILVGVILLTLHVLIYHSCGQVLPTDLVATAHSEEIKPPGPPRTKAVSCPGTRLTNFQSQSNEDRVLVEIFKDMCKGTYVELGALDGIRYSNTYVFHQDLEWQGILVELSPANYVNLKANRKHELAVVNAGICDTEKTVHFMQVQEGAVNGIWEFAAQSFREYWWGGMSPEKDGVPIACLPLSYVLGNVSIPFFADFFSLDVEGAELQVLNSVDFNKSAFGVLVIEADGQNPEKDANIRKLLLSKGYSYLKNHERSDWFVNQQWETIYNTTFRFY